MKDIKRRSFLKSAIGGLMALFVGVPKAKTNEVKDKNNRAIKKNRIEAGEIYIDEDGSEMFIPLRFIPDYFKIVVRNRFDKDKCVLYEWFRSDQTDIALITSQGIHCKLQCKKGNIIQWMAMKL